VGRYVTTAALLGLGWFVVLLLPGMTRGWLVENALSGLLLLPLASVLVALTFRGFIARAATFGQHLLRAVVLPYVGCAVYLGLWAAWWWAEHAFSGNLANLHDTLSVFAMGLVATAVSCFVVVPWGLVCQYALCAAADHFSDSSVTPSHAAPGG